MGEGGAGPSGKVSDFLPKIPHLSFFFLWAGEILGSLAISKGLLARYQASWRGFGQTGDI